MRKIVIPAILAATVFVAGMFAFMPVQEASTVHTSISTEINDLCKKMLTSATLLGGSANVASADAATICSGVGI